MRALVLVVFVFVCSACECAAVESVPDAAAVVYRQDACARWLITHQARGCSLDTWTCPVDVEGPPLAPQEVSDCDADIALAEGCDVPSCEVP